jgi:hypothetical protein
LLPRSHWLFHGGCFATEVALVSSLADALLSLLLEARLTFYGWMLCHSSYDFSVEINVLVSIFLTCLVCMGVCGSLYVYFVALVCLRSFTTTLVVYNLRHEGFLIVASCSSLPLNETCATSRLRKKIINILLIISYIINLVIFFKKNRLNTSCPE